MAGNSQVKLTKLEMEIMEAVWELGTASVREIQEQLPERKRPAYTTVQTIIIAGEIAVWRIRNAERPSLNGRSQGAHKRFIDVCCTSLAAHPACSWRNWSKPDNLPWRIFVNSRTP